MKMKYFIPMLMLAALTGCSEKYASHSRIAVPAMNAAGIANSNLIAPLQSAMEEPGIFACAQIEKLSSQDPSEQLFSYFSSIHDGKGAIDISSFPLAQMVLGEKFKTSTDD